MAHGPSLNTDGQRVFLFGKALRTPRKTSLQVPRDSTPDVQSAREAVLCAAAGAAKPKAL